MNNKFVLVEAVCAGAVAGAVSGTIIKKGIDKKLDALMFTAKKQNELEESSKESASALEKIEQLQNQLNAQINRTNKFKKYFDLFDKWLEALERGKDISAFLRKYHYSKIAIYGMGVLGRHLYYALQDTDIEIIYVIDQNQQINSQGLKVYTMQDELPEVDAIIVTPVFAFEEIESKLSEKAEYPIVSLEEIIYEI